MVHKSTEKFRLRAFYKPTGRDSWVTTVWRNNEKEAEEDRMFTNERYANIRVIKKSDWEKK